MGYPQNIRIYPLQCYFPIVHLNSFIYFTFPQMCIILSIRNYTIPIIHPNCHRSPTPEHDTLTISAVFVSITHTNISRWKTATDRAENRDIVCGSKATEFKHSVVGLGKSTLVQVCRKIPPNAHCILFRTRFFLVQGVGELLLR